MTNGSWTICVFNKLWFLPTWHLFGVKFTRQFVHQPLQLGLYERGVNWGVLWTSFSTSWPTEDGDTSETAAIPQDILVNLIGNFENIYICMSRIKYSIQNFTCFFSIKNYVVLHFTLVFFYITQKRSPFCYNIIKLTMQVKVCKHWFSFCN